MNVAVHVINSSDVLKHNFLYKSIYGQDNFKRISHEITFLRRNKYRYIWSLIYVT